ncbi:MAG TPA: exodeoxyribonuclease V subunit gamma, partial [Spirochaetota bacterium]|nr:exodeoxyribonuclease V subunit gamma [Spirochaetota bacterium]
MPLPGADHIQYLNVDLRRFPDKDYAARMLPDSLFAPPPLVICRSQLLGEWLKYRITAALGSMAALKTMLPSQSIRKFSQLYPEVQAKLHEGDRHKKLLLEDDLTAVLIPLLQDIAGSKDRRYTYLSSALTAAEKDNQDREAKVLHLGGLIAKLFRDYSLNQPQIITAWLNDQPAQVSMAMKKHEQWQRYLWQEIFAGDRPYA